MQGDLTSEAWGAANPNTRASRNSAKYRGSNSDGGKSTGSGRGRIWWTLVKPIYAIVEREHSMSEF
jgi:hypothetical protein